MREKVIFSISAFVMKIILVNFDVLFRQHDFSHFKCALNININSNVLKLICIVTSMVI